MIHPYKMVAPKAHRTAFFAASARVIGDLEVGRYCFALVVECCVAADA